MVVKGWVRATGETCWGCDSSIWGIREQARLNCQAEGRFTWPAQKALQARSCPHTRRSGDSSLSTDTWGRKWESTRGSLSISYLSCGGAARFPLATAEDRVLFVQNLLKWCFTLKKKHQKGKKHWRIHNLEINSEKVIFKVFFFPVLFLLNSSLKLNWLDLN